MQQFLRALFRPKVDERQERLNAYLDNALPPDERRQFEQTLADDPALQATLDHFRLLKLNLSRLPRHRAPRSFALSAAVHGRRRPKPAAQMYPFLRGAVALTAFFLVLAVVMDLLTAGAGQMSMSAADSAMEGEAIALMEAPLVEPRMMPAPEIAPGEVEPEAAMSAMAVEEETAAADDAAFDEPLATLTPDKTAEARRPSAPVTEPPAPEIPAEQPSGGVDAEAAPPIAPEQTAAAPTATLFAPLAPPLEATPWPTMLPELTAPASRNPWRTIQFALGASLITLLAVTLYLRRRL